MAEQQAVSADLMVEVGDFIADVAGVKLSVSGSNLTLKNNKDEALSTVTVGGGTGDYDDLTDKPSINSETLSGNKTSADIGVADAVHSHDADDITSGTLDAARIPDLSGTYAAATHSHGDITSGGDITAAAATVASGDMIVINDDSASKVTNGPAFGSDTTKYLRNDGVWDVPAGGGSSDTGWQDITPASGWTNYSAERKVQYRKIGSIVEIRGAVKRASSSITLNETYQTIFTLPSGARPDRDVSAICQASGVKIWHLQINSSGVVQAGRMRTMNTTTYQQATTSEWMVFDVTFMAG